MTNRLAHETSPYLLQHAENPVDWYPWNDQALALARQRDCPIFLSIGYSACHWCHVMEHESFENAEIATFLNDHFVPIKVDREERPDLDQIYMAAVQLLTGRGGWPMSVFLTPGLKPFFGGTYWPATASRGMPGFDQVLRAVWDAWENRREQATQQAEMLTERIELYVAAVEPGQDTAGETTLRAAATRLEQAFDFTNGGFGSAPKFPHPMALDVLLRTWLRTGRTGLLDLVCLNLDKMAQGGIYDHLGGGFARYSVDGRWLVPHFEKMLYDNAQLASIYVDAFTATGERRYATFARKTLDYVLRDMTDPGGGFHSAEDADSEGVEGKFYVWTPAQIHEVLGESLADRFCYAYDVSDAGNFEDGSSILNLPKTLDQVAQVKGWDHDELVSQMAEAKQQLLAARAERIRPSKDDKVLASWNGLMIHAMARAGGALSEHRYVQAAVASAHFVLQEMRDDQGRLLHSYRRGQSRFLAYLDDYACMVNGLVSVYEATADECWIAAAIELADAMLDRFSGHDSGRLYYTASDHEVLITRVSDLHDSATPSGNAMAATAFVRLGGLLGREAYFAAARRIVDSATETMKGSPLAAGQMLVALDMLTGPFSEFVVVGGNEPASRERALSHLRSAYAPNKVIAVRPSASDQSVPDLDWLFADRPMEEIITLYVCEGSTCQRPLRGADEIVETPIVAGRPDAESIADNKSQPS